MIACVGVFADFVLQVTTCLFTILSHKTPHGYHLVSINKSPERPLSFLVWFFIIHIGSSHHSSWIHRSFLFPLVSEVAHRIRLFSMWLC